MKQREYMRHMRYTLRFFIKGFTRGVTRGVTRKFTRDKGGRGIFLHSRLNLKLMYHLSAIFLMIF
jgi:hypothetical protein